MAKSSLHGASEEVLSGMSELELAASAPIVTEDSDAGAEIDQESVAKNLMPPLQFGHCSTTMPWPSRLTRSFLNSKRSGLTYRR